MHYEDVQAIDREAAERAFASGEPALVTRALVALALHERDWRWVQNQALSRLSDPNPEIRGTAATCLGHLARLHGASDHHVKEALEQLVGDPLIAGRVEDALDDIQQYARRPSE